jgi:hypothetical protein
MIHSLFKSLYGLVSGRDCRVCGESIPRVDGFGVSEGVCNACRHR